jgi:hypothetical protein
LLFHEDRLPDPGQYTQMPVIVEHREMVSPQLQVIPASAEQEPILANLSCTPTILANSAI